MKNFSKQLFQSLLADINRYQHAGLPWVEEIEKCFSACELRCTLLKKKLSDYHFKSTATEIYFFKKIKPLFAARQEYYSLLYHAELFCPEVEVKKFWLRESNRLDQFIIDHREFWFYMQNGCTDKDEFYFVRANRDPGDFLYSKIYDMDGQAATSHDHLHATLLALKKYTNYVSVKLEGFSCF